MKLRTPKHLLISVFIPVVCFLQAITPACAQDSTALNYYAVRAAHPPVIDGIEGKDEWKGVAWSAWFTDITGDRQKKPQYQTRVKLQYDDSILYVLAWMEEPHVTAQMRAHDDLLFKENDFEVFIDADGDGKDYTEIEINALGTVMDLKLDKAYREGGKADMSWDTKGMRTAVRVQGTLNLDSDKDKGWIAELAIPFAALSGTGLSAAAHSWRINFLRVEHSKASAGNDTLPHENYWSWAPQGAVNMHIPEKWGYLHLTK